MPRGSKNLCLAASTSVLPIVSDLMGLPPNLVSKAPCKFEMLRPQELAVWASRHHEMPSTDISRTSSAAERAPEVQDEQRLSVDSLLSAVHKSLLAKGRGNSTPDESLGNHRGHSREMDVTGLASTKREMGMIDRSQRLDLLTRATPSANVTVSNFRQRPRSCAPALSSDYLKKVHREIFTALRQKCHTVTIIFGYLHSRAAEELTDSRAHRGMGTNTAKKNAIGRDDFKTAIAQLGLGLVEAEIVAVYDLNADLRTGELTFNNLQRAIKGVSTPNTPRVATPRGESKEPKESDKIRNVLKLVWESAAEAFVFFDISGADGLNQVQLRKGLKRLRLNHIRLETAFQEIDLDRDGRISERDFIKHFAPGWHPLSDFIQTRKEYEFVKAKGRHRVAQCYKAYIDRLNAEDSAKTPSRVQSPVRPPKVAAQAQELLQPEGDGDVLIDIVLDLDFAKTRGAEEEMKRGIQRDVAFSCNAAMEKVRVLALRAGSVIAEIVLSEGLCANGRSPLLVAKDLQQQMHDEQSSLLLCEYTCYVLDILITNTSFASNHAQHDTPEPFDSVSSQSKSFCSPFITSLDLHGFDYSAPRRGSNEAPQFVDYAQDNRKDGIEMLCGEGQFRRSHLGDVTSLQSGSQDSAFRRGNSRNRENHPDEWMARDSFHRAGRPRRSPSCAPTSNETLLPDDDSCSQLDDVSDHHDDTDNSLFEEFHHRSSLSTSRSMRGGTGPSIGTVHSNERIGPTDLEPANDDNVMSTDLVPTYDDNVMSGAKLAGLRLQIKRQQVEDLRFVEKEKNLKHRRMLMEKRRHQRLMQEAARLERSPYFSFLFLSLPCNLLFQQCLPSRAFSIFFLAHAFLLVVLTVSRARM